MRKWYRTRQLRRFHQRCNQFGIPEDVRERIWRGGGRIVDWYAGRHQ